MTPSMLVFVAEEARSNVFISAGLHRLSGLLLGHFQIMALLQVSTASKRQTDGDSSRLHQQLAGLLSIALAKENSAASSTTAGATTTPSNNTTTSSSSQEVDESNRLAAIDSLHRLVVYPPNSVVVAHTAGFLSQGFSQLLSDKSYSVRQSAATAYGALCSVLCSIPIGSNGRQNNVILGTLVDRFINWALPLLCNVGASDGSMELALESLREFLSAGEAGAIERYAFPILKACQGLLEDERTSLNLLHHLLSVLTIISLKFFRCFQPHFVDIVDLLLGWAMVPDLAESDRRVIMGSFLQFQKHWVGNLQFPLGLLLKFLGDMDALLQDGSPGSPQQFQRLLTLLSCFSAVLQSTASGMLEMNLLEQIVEPLGILIPKFFGCLSMVGKKFGWSNWIEDSWRCLTLLAEILRENFSSFFPLALDVLFQSLNLDDSIRPAGAGNITSFQIHGVLKTNLQLLSLQKLGFLPSSVPKILQFDAPISQLRLHPNHLVTASCAATYVFLLQHGNDEVVDRSFNSLIEELILLKGILEEVLGHRDVRSSNLCTKLYSKHELLALIKFNLRVLLSCVCMGTVGSSGQPELATLCLRRSEKVVSFIVRKLNPFGSTIESCVELQANILEMLARVSSIELLSKCSISGNNGSEDSLEKRGDVGVNENLVNHRQSRLIVDHLKNYINFLLKALDDCTPFIIKLKALDWIHRFGMDVMTIFENLDVDVIPYEKFGCGNTVQALVSSVLVAASDREPKVRSQVAEVFELLLQANLINPMCFVQVAQVVLEKLGDADAEIRSKFVKLLSVVLPVTAYVRGVFDNGIVTAGRFAMSRFGSRHNLHWRQVFALKQLHRRLHSQQLVSILSYISQRWKAPLSSWIKRLIYSCKSSKNLVNMEEAGTFGVNNLLMDIEAEDDILERTSSVDDMAGICWAINEAARYCTATRLRTNLGGPTQTFAALERMLLDVAHVLELDTEQNDGSVSIMGSSGAHLLPMRLLLEFVEALKKNVYNAYDGSSILPCPSRQSFLFFRANKKVCEEWFSRICEPMMNAGLALQCHDATIHYCTLRMQELQNSASASLKDNHWVQAAENLHNIRSRLAGDVLRIVRHMALALCKKHESEALIGLQKWAYMAFCSLLAEEKQFFSRSEVYGPFSWITGLVYQAEGQYERSAAFFTHLLQTEESLSSLGAEGVQFAIARVVESYTAISDWKSLESWLLELQALRAKHAGKSYSGALTTAGNEMNQIHALAHFDEGDLPAAWASLDLTPKSSCELTLDPKLALQRSEQILLQAMLYQKEGKVDKVPNETQKAKSMLDEVLTVLPLDGLQEAAPYAAQLHCIFVLEEGCRLSGSQDKTIQFGSVLNSFLQAMPCSINKFRQDCDSWMKVFRVYQTVLPTFPVTLHLCKNLISLERKQRNLVLANRLKSYMRDHVHSCSEASYKNFLISCLQYEEILLMFAENKIADAFSNMWSYVRSCMLSFNGVGSSAGDSFLKAKACLKLSNWLRRDYPGLSLEEIFHKIHSDLNMVDDINESSGEDRLAPAPSLHMIIEEIAGRAAKLSTRLCPTMGKSWIAYASWCFGQGKGALASSHEVGLGSFSVSQVLGSEVLPQRMDLTEDEVSKVESIILQHVHGSGDAKCSSEWGGWNLWVESAGDISNVNSGKSLVQKVVNVIETAAGAPGAEDFGIETLFANLASQLQLTLQAENIQAEETSLSSSLHELVDICWSLRKRRVSLFGHAALGFIQYLSHSTSKLCGGPCSFSDNGSLSKKSGSLSLRAALYILHILLNYGVELKDTLGPALSAVPLLPWQEITPQLFARLSSHPEHGIRKQLEGLLMMLAKLSPWSIVYPTLVDVNTSDEEPAEELQNMLGSLMKLYPKIVQDVRLMIRELGNVTVLWEELWLSTLQDLHGDVMRRINLLKEEAARIAGNVTLSHGEKSIINAAKYSAMMAPIVVALERRLALISREPETPHERWFQEEYKEQLQLAISMFKTPPASAAALADVWRPFDNIAASLASYQRKSSVSLKEVAPQLACLSSSDIPMPGLEKQVMLSESDMGPTTTEGIVTVTSFSEQVAILPTKTKPKKLVMVGSDGEKYTYLLKGREDLRLDARIMQLLQALNNFLHSSSATRCHAVSIRYYSVTPISGRAGLIQWVDNVISIYSVFKSWQQRVQFAQLPVTGGGNTKGTVLPPVPRPSDMFYGKIIPALKEKGIRRVISRRDWPHGVKCKVLLDLMKETPRQLLYQELWCASEGFKTFNAKLKRYSGSLAAMSMVGHILGLGDRHLDNILMDFFSGDIVHIDYNVCFDKGQRLKVPEIVPFRLTQTLEAALGLTGVEGVFRSNCEAVIDVLRRNKDILLMLLEVFVWDPLVEWTRGDFHDDAALGGEERKGMELAVGLSLFASRVQEMRVPLQEHHDLLLATIAAVESSLERFLDVLNQYELVSALFYCTDQERSTLLLQETSAKSIVAEATSNSEKTRALYEIQAREFAQAKAVVTEKAQEAATWIEQHGRILDAVRSGSIPEVHSCIKLSGMRDALCLTTAVSVAGIPLTIVPEPTQAQCHDIDREVSHLIGELDQGVSSAVTALQAYSLALQRILPLNYLMTSPMHGWAHTLQLAVNTLSSDALSHARRHAGELISKAEEDGVGSVRHHHDEMCLKVEKYALEIQKLEEEYAELVNSIGSEMESKAKDHLLSAFMRYMQSSRLARKEEPNSPNQHGQLKHGVAIDAKMQGELYIKKEKIFSVLHAAICSVYSEVKHKLLNILKDPSKINTVMQPYLGTISSELEEQIEKCILVSEFVTELQKLIGSEIEVTNRDAYCPRNVSEGNWASNFKGTLLLCKDIVIQMTEVVLPDVIKSIVSFNSEVMDAFGALSQIRGSIETALEQLVEVELERASLEELAKSYFVKVGLITEQQLALEEAAMKGRDHLSWEEAEELASQEEACRAQLDLLHQTWSEKDTRASSLTKKEAGIKNVLVLSEQHFQSLLSSQDSRGLHGIRSKALLSALAKPFIELESFDEALSAYHNQTHSSPSDISSLAEYLSSGSQISEYIWKFKGLLNSRSFFIWKVGIIDFVLDSSIHDVSSFVDQNLCFDQIVDVLKKKLMSQLQELIGHYLIEQIAPALLGQLDERIENLKQHTEVTKDLGFDQVQKDTTAIKWLKLMLDEYCNAHETVRAARSAATLVRRQVNDLKEAMQRTCLEIVQMEWMHDATLNPSHNSRIISQKFIEKNDKSYQLVLNLSRPNLLEGIRTVVSKIARSIEGLQACERTSVTAEGQLERAMNWACGGPNPSMAGSTSWKSSGIPPEFHEHLRTRRQLLWEAREKATDVMKICMAILEFEASRDGILCIPGEIFPSRAGADGRAWQQAYLNALTRLDVTFHSFSRAEQEWKLAQKTVEAASNGLFSATNELCIASVKAKSASGDLQSTLLQMRDCAYEASVALSAFSRVAKGHTALTSECGSMLEEVLTITEGLHDVHNLGKEAGSVHYSLMEDLSKAGAVLLPLESVLSKDVATMTDAMAKERETKLEISPIHGQAIYQSYSAKIREACQMFKPLVPVLVSSVSELYSMLIGLAQTASLHAGNMHKALEGLGEVPEARSQEINLSRENVVDTASKFDNMKGDILSGAEGEMDENGLDFNLLSTQEEGWVSPPDSMYSSSSESGSMSGNASLSNGFSCQEAMEQLSIKPDAGDWFESLPFSGTVNQEILQSRWSESNEMVAKHGHLCSISIVEGNEHEKGVRSPTDFSVDALDDTVKEENLEAKLQPRDVTSLISKVEVDDESRKGQPSKKDGARVSRGKNAFAMSILRRIDMKIDGRDIAENREITVAEQVEYLLKQATSIDNLCNMYEGWTPWI
ncbi:Serine/threonine-protein kinase smg1 [Ancistrocladus abbreviatus]